MAHRYILGMSGSGKSTLMLHHAIEAVHDNHGVLYLDPHGEDSETLMANIPKRRLEETILFDPTHCTIPWNPLRSTNPPLAATVLSDTIKDAWGYAGMPTPVMDMYLYMTLACLIEKDKPLTDALSVLENGATVSDTVLQQFYARFKQMTDKEQRADTASTINKFYTLFADPRLRDIFATPKDKLCLSDRTSQIIIARLPQGQLGLSKVRLLGSMLLAQLHLACLARPLTTPLHVFVDEVHHFSPTTLAEMLSGLRKFGVSLTVAHQYIDQVPQQLYAALMGNCRDRYLFNLSREDAERLRQTFGRNGPLGLDEIPPHRYRKLPENKDYYTEPVAKPYPHMPEKIRDYTRRHWCRKSG